MRKSNESKFRGWGDELIGSSTKSIIGLGRLIVSMGEVKKSELEGLSVSAAASEWWGFSSSRTSAYRQIGNAANVLEQYLERLPQSWDTIHLLAKLEPEILEVKIDGGAINPGTKRAEVLELLGKSPKSNRKFQPAGKVSIDDMWDACEELTGAESVALVEEVLSKLHGDDVAEFFPTVIWPMSDEELADALISERDEDSLLSLVNSIMAEMPDDAIKNLLSDWAPEEEPSPEEAG